ncbi:MAG: DUF3786 domain-containing protein [Chloroflexi bacterium]|nr:DUF3786 domain-containing protein [Chloroflexota bacterium]
MENALQKAISKFALLNPIVTAARSGANYEKGIFRLKFYERVFLVAYPDARIEETGNNKVPQVWEQIILLHYLIQAKGTEVADNWVAYRHLPGASLFEKRFKQMTINPLLNTFGNDAGALKRAGNLLGGMPINRTGDAAFRFLAFPRIPVACILHLGEDEIPSSINVLFDEAAPDYLPTEDLSYVGMYLGIALRKAISL